MVIDDDGSMVTVPVTIMTENIKTIHALSERSLTQYSPHLSVFSLVQAEHRCAARRMTFLSLACSLGEIVTLFYFHT